jgi:subtilisin-like proprotein convertase family protein
MYRKLGILLVVLLCSAAVTFAVPQTYKHSTPLTKADVNEPENFIPAPSDLPPVGSRNPNTLDEIIISENFDSYGNDQLPTSWTQVDVDGGYCAQFVRNSTWQVFNYGAANAHSGTNVAMNHYNDNGLANNDWLILPQQNLSGTITLSYWVATQQATYPESYEVKVSTTGTQPANFTNLIYSNSSVPAAWTQQTHDLSAYAGAPFYIAFHYISVDMFVIKLDDLVLEAGTPSAHGALSGTVTTDASGHAPISGATVEITGTALSTLTNAQGLYMFNNVPPDTYDVVFSHPAYNSVTESDVIIVDGDTTTVDRELHPLPLAFYNYTSTGAASAISDLDTAYKTLDIPDDYLIFDLDITINITHPYDSDLEVWLLSPWNQMVSLAANRGGSGDNFVNCRFDDEAANPISGGTAPFTGSYRPEESLSAFDGFSSQGTWTVVVYDGWAQDSGAINNFTVHVTVEVEDAAPDVHSQVPATFAFHGNYPNPFNATTQFRFDLGAQSRVELVLYNTLGQQVAQLVNNVLSAGSHTVSFDASALTAGLYFARLNAQGLSETRKVILLK